MIGDIRRPDVISMPVSCQNAFSNINHYCFLLQLAHIHTKGMQSTWSTKNCLLKIGVFAQNDSNNNKERSKLQRGDWSLL